MKKTVSIEWPSIEKKIYLRLEVANTRLKRQQGLARRTLNSIQDGMLFIYDAPTYATFTVAEMLFPLTMAWYDASGIFINSRNVEPGPTPVAAPGKFQYLLEVPTGNNLPPLTGSYLKIVN